jgi:regulator of RNase E activity RraA
MQQVLEQGLTTAHLADACLRLEVQPRSVPLRAISTGSRLSGPAVPVRHFGSVDIFLEAIDAASPGSVLVVDNQGRLDEACLGDLVSLEAATAALAGIVIWGCHRDTAEIRAIGLPLFSLGAIPAGPERLDARDDAAFNEANVGNFSVSQADFVVADDDGVLFLPADLLEKIVGEAQSIRETERQQAELVRQGKSLREQLQLAHYVERRRLNPELTFRMHLHGLGAAIEEGFH